MLNKLKPLDTWDQMVKIYESIDSKFPHSELINIPVFFCLALLGTFTLRNLGVGGMVISIISLITLIFILIRSAKLQKVFGLMLAMASLASFATILICFLVQLLVEISNFTVKLGGSKELVVALVTLLTAVLTFTAGKVFEHWLDIQQQVSDEIKPTYKKFNSFLIALRDKNISSQEQERFIIEIDAGIFSWGSYAVKKHWNQVRADLLSKGLSDQNLLPKLEKLWLALRKQVGLPKETGNQLSSFLNWKHKILNNK